MTRSALRWIAAALVCALPTVNRGGALVDQGAGAGSSQRPWSTTTKIADYQRGAFGSILDATEQVEIHLQFPYSINSRLVTTTVTNGGTVTQAANLAVLATSAANNGSATIASNSAIKYTPGQGVTVRFTGIFTACTASSQQEEGLGDLADGYFFGCNGGAFGILRRANSVDNWTAQTAWNGSRAPTLDITKGNVYSIDFQWLGFGAIRFFIEDSNTGEPVLVHTIRYANTATSPSTFNPSLPLRARVFNSGNTSSVSLSIGSMGASTQGPRNDFGVNNASVNTKSGVSTTTTNILTIQNRATFNSITNRTRIKLTSISASVTSLTSANAIVRIVHAGTEGGVPSFTNVDTTRSIVAIDTAGTTVTGGDFIFPLTVAGANGQQNYDLEGKNYRLDPGDTYNFTCEASSGTGTCTVGVSWREEF